jgi:type I restriction enzyme S subunit
MTAQTHTFAELVRLRILEIGDGYRAKNEELGGNGPIFLRGAYLQDSGFNFTLPDRFVETNLGGFGGKVAAFGDVVVTTKGNSTGRVGRIRDGEVGAIYSPHLSYWRSKNRSIVDQLFLYYWSRSPEFTKQLSAMSSSTDMAPYLSLSDQMRLRLSLPRIEEQREIGGMLSGLDDKIDLNRRMNETIEAMARAIFKDWFVEFGPTRAKMEGRPPYLAPDLWALFPDRLDDVGKPEGWEMRPLDQTARFLNGLALQKFPTKGDGALPVIKIAQLRAGRATRDEMASALIPADYVVRDGDLLFSWSGSLLHRIWSGGRGALNQHLFKVVPNGVPQWFVFEWIAEHMESFRSIAASKATTMGHIQRHHLAEAAVCMPHHTIMAAADSLIAPQFAKMLANDLETRTLAAIRDLLLPKLMSGEVRVREAEKMLAAVA